MGCIYEAEYLRGLTWGRLFVVQMLGRIFGVHRWAEYGVDYILYMETYSVINKAMFAPSYKVYLPDYRRSWNLQTPVANWYRAVWSHANTRRNRGSLWP